MIKVIICDYCEKRSITIAGTEEIENNSGKYA